MGQEAGDGDQDAVGRTRLELGLDGGVDVVAAVVLLMDRGKCTELG